MINIKFASIIQNHFFFIVLLANFFFQLVQSYYIFPFKILKPELSSLYQEFPDKTKEEIYLSYLNLVSIYTYINSGNSKIYELIFKVSEKCSFQSNSSCITNYKSNPFNNFAHKNENISNIINLILDNSPKEECTNIKIGLAMPGFGGIGKCVSIVNEVKNNDNSINTTSYNFKFYNEEEIKQKGFDGELIMGEEPHRTESDIYDKNDFITVYNHVNDYYYNYDIWDGKYVNFSFIFAKIFYYVNNTKEPEYINYVNATENDEGAIDFELGLNKCPFTYYALIKLIFFDQYFKNNACRETIISGGFYGILCNKKNINTKEFYEKFPTLYFYNVFLNYTFILDRNDLFIEKEETIYFTLISRNEIINNWRFGHIFLKKYRLVFDHDKKSIGYYVKHNEIIPNNVPTEGEQKQEPGKKLSTGMIVLIIGICLLIGEFIAAVICIKKCKCLNRKKRANELLDDNYEYTTVNPEENKVIN